MPRRQPPPAREPTRVQMHVLALLCADWTLSRACLADRAACLHWGELPYPVRRGTVAAMVTSGQLERLPAMDSRQRWGITDHGRAVHAYYAPPRRGRPPKRTAPCSSAPS